MTTRLSLTTLFQINFKMTRFGNSNVQSINGLIKKPEMQPTITNIFGEYLWNFPANENMN